jgi:phenylacetic acid degradation operon negative regulatory protein
MKARTELLLYQMAYAFDRLSRPTWKNIDATFGSWAYGNGLLRQIQRLEAQAYIESSRDETTGKRVIRLTEKGLAAGRIGWDPDQRWARPWDGKWRMVLFDLPENERSLRDKLRKSLIGAGFGCMQRSVWIAPDPMTEMAAQLRAMVVNAAGLVLLEASPCGGESAADMVQAAWDFKRIDLAWEALAAHLKLVPDGGETQAHQAFQRWSAKERELLQRCLRLDPLLPASLLPSGYRGTKVWKQRGDAIQNLVGELN